MAQNKKLFFQFMIAINRCFKPNVDKHSYKRSNCNKEIIFSYSYRRKIIEVVDQLCKYIAQEYIEIKLIKEINSTYIQEFICFKENTCTYQTLKSYLYILRKVEKMVRQEMNLKIDYTGNVTIRKSKGIKRNISMKEEDFSKISIDLENSKSKSAIGIKLGAIFGLRVSEICKLQGRDINLERKKIHIHESKGKRSRDLDIDTEAKVELCKKIKKYIMDKERIVPLREDSVNAFLRRKLLKNNITKYNNKATGVHAIRKMYAKKEFEKQINNGNSIKDSIDKVSVALGHSEGRKITYTAYIGSK